MKSFKLPTFVTDRLILREIKEEDAPTYEKYFAVYDVISELNHSVPWPYPEGSAYEYIVSEIIPNQGKDIWYWGIFLKENPDEIIGAIGLWKNGDPENRGFWLAKEFWGKGIMTEAAQPITDYAFNFLDFDKLVFANAVGNIRSRRIKEKAGAKLVRIEPAKYVNPKYTEREIWELMKTEWKVLGNSKQD